MFERYMQRVGERSISALWQDRRARRTARRSGSIRRSDMEALEQRTLLTVSIINGGGSGYVGNGGGGPPDITGAAGPSSYLEISNSTVTLFSPKSNRTILAQSNISNFFYTAGGQTVIDAPGSVFVNIAASPTGATEAGNTVTITTTAPHNFTAGQNVTVTGVGVAGYNGTFAITGVTATTFTYVDPVAGLSNSGGGTATVDPGSCGVCDSTGFFDPLMGANGRFVIGDIDIDGTTNVSQFIFAVSKSSNPTTFTAADWNFYHVTTTRGSGSSQTWTDYPGNPGYNADAVVVSFNKAQGGKLTGDGEILSINANDLANGVSQGALNFFINDIKGSNSYRPTAMQDSAPGDPMWLIRNPNDGLKVDVVRMNNVLSNAATFATTSLALPAANTYAPSGVSNPLDSEEDDAAPDVALAPDNPGNTAANDIDDRILNASEFNNTIAASQKVAVGTASLATATLQINNGTPVGGSGYKVGDTLTVSFGTFTTAAQLTVASVGGAGNVTSVTIANAGTYSSLSGINGTVTGGAGSGAQFSLVFKGETDVQWYAIDVSGATPAFQQVGGVANVGRIGFGQNTYCVDPAIAINPSGEIGLGFMESDTTGGAINAATGGFISTFVTARKATDPAGTMQPIVLVPAGKGTAAINARIGDFSGMNVDPVNGTFWHVNEFGGGGPTVIANFTPEARPVVTPPSDQAAVEGAAKAFNLGSFTDPDGSPWSVDVNWGDGTAHTTFSAASAGSLGTQSHTYAEEGSDVVTVTVTDNTGLSASATFNVAVSDPAVVPTAQAITAVEGADTGSITVATFTDPGGPEAIGDYSAVINWGDGTPTSTGIISVSGGVFSVTGNHTYAEESAADHPGSSPYQVTVTISHETAPDAVANSTATVSDPAVIATGGFTFTAVEGMPSGTQTVATFTDPGGAEPLADYTANIDWGDGTTSPGTITFAAGVFTVQGDHTYATGLGGPADFGNTLCDANPPKYHKPITVTITHEKAPTATAVSDATISIPPASAHKSLVDGSLIVVGTTGEDRISFVPVGNQARTVNVRLGSTSLGTFTVDTTGRIVVAALDGSDEIQVPGSINVDTALYGGPGSDRINGGGGQNIEVGCEGDDTLLAGRLGDLLVGGTGSDRIVGGNGDDILVAGTVVDATNAEDDKYADLVGILTAGGITLPFKAADDGVVDRLTGGAGIDTGYFNFTGPGIQDIFTDKPESLFDV